MWWKWVLAAVASLAGLIALLALVGLALPRGHVATASARYPADTDRVWSLVSDVGTWPRWNGRVSATQRLADRNGHPVWRVEDDRGAFTIEVVEIDPQRRMITRIVDEAAFGGTWTWELEVEGEGTRVRLTEDGEIHNPLFRTIATLFFDHAATVDAWMAALGAELSS